jgi:hypothetical protein
MNTYQNQQKQVREVRWPYCGINKCKLTTIPNNKTDIIIRNNKKGTCMIIDVAIPGHRNVIKKEAEKILKYKDLTIEIQRMWNVKTRVYQ